VTTADRIAPHPAAAYPAAERSVADEKGRALRVLVCEDSQVYAAALCRMLEWDGDIEVAAVCNTAQAAIAALPNVRPDLVTMDVELPGLNGIVAVEEIMSSRPLPILVLSAHLSFGNDRAVAALAAGALDALAKEDLDLADPGGSAGAAFRHRVKVLSRVPVIRHPRARLARRSRIPGRSDLRATSVIGVCASTGGPRVLARLLGGLPADYPIPLLVVQHIATGFTEGLARWLDQSVPLPVDIARDGLRPGPGAWIAPEGAHLKLTRSGRLSLDRRADPGRHRPSGDVLLESIAATAGRRGVAVVLTGMGNDGARGAAAVHRHGGLAIAQDERSSAVYGMPKAAIELGVDLVLSPAEIAGCLLRLRPEPFAVAR
jgi:two-component system, chemotaxis family, protein-glutamate methylesterase/glutaminase